MQHNANKKPTNMVVLVAVLVLCLVTTTRLQIGTVLLVLLQQVLTLDSLLPRGTPNKRHVEKQTKGDDEMWGCDSR
jgi:hypothetical protein